MPVTVSLTVSLNFLQLDDLLSPDEDAGLSSSTTTIVLVVVVVVDDDVTDDVTLCTPLMVTAYEKIYLARLSLCFALLLIYVVKQI